MKKLFLILVLIITLTACTIPITEMSLETNSKHKETSIISIIEIAATDNKAANSPDITTKVTLQPTSIMAIKPTQVATPIMTPTPTIVPTAKPKETATKELAPTPTVEPTQAPTPKATAKPAPVTAKPTIKPTPASTPKPVAGEGYMDDMTPASQSYINSVLSAINKKRKANGIDNAILDSVLSSSCNSHAKSMAAKGQAFHSSNVVGCEGVSRNHYSMPAGTLGSAMVAHVGQLATSDTIKIGIGVVYYGDYMYVCIRGN